jgi:hypothetical protein
MPFEGTPAADRMKEINARAAPKNRFPTAIMSLVSAVVKMSRKAVVPADRAVFRGLGGMRLKDDWFRKDERGVTTGVELGFMSTTLERGVAMQYSGVRRGEAGNVMGFDVGAVDFGARLSDLSQYAGTQWMNRL